MQQLPLGVRLRERATFDSFIPGANAEAIHFLRAAAAGLSARAWLWGGPGVGKTHLLHALCAASDPSQRVSYLPLMDVPDPERAALDGWAGLDLLCVDDLPLMVGNAVYERALFALFRDYEDRGARLIVAARRPPGAFAWSMPDIGSRFGGSPLFQIRALDESDQSIALRARAAARGMELPDETLSYLQRRFPRDMGTLCVLLDELDDASLSAQRQLTVPFIRQVLGD